MISLVLEGVRMSGGVHKARAWPCAWRGACVCSGWLGPWHPGRVDGSACVGWREGRVVVYKLVDIVHSWGGQDNLGKGLVV